MRLSIDQLQMRLLNKIRNQNMLTTNKKNNYSQLSPPRTDKKTPSKISKIKPIQYISPEISPYYNKNLQTQGILKSFVSRQDYYECVVEMIGDKMAGRRNFMIDRYECPQLWIGKVYLVEEDQQVNLGGFQVAFAKLRPFNF